MTWYSYLLLTYAIAYLLYAFILLAIARQVANLPRVLPSTSLPIISILVAAKNEQQNIIRCLESLSMLDYPSELYEVLIGNDDSTDNTATLVQQYIADKPHFKLIHITEKLGKADAKANVLAHLALQAKGDYFFITDADIAVQPLWVKTLLAYHHTDTGIVSGSTAIAGTGLFAKLQNIEWMYAFGMIAVAKRLGIPVTAVGNNMAICRAAYLSTGGYENLKFSITEDFELFRATLQKGWKFDNITHPHSIAYSMPTKTLTALLKQRKRWMHGAVEVPKSLGIFLAMQAIYMPVVLAAFFVAPLYTLVFVNLKMGLQYLFIAKTLKKATLPVPSISFYLVFECYAALVSILTIVYYLLPTKVEWKGRKY